MKSILKFILLLILPMLASSCEEDEDKNIQTDLSIEANQLFGISNAWGESLYFGLLLFEDYSQIPNTELPGCPNVLIDVQARRVTLTFDPANSCEQSGKVKRTGKLILQYPLLNTTSSKWSLSYQDYILKNDSIQGTREFFYSNLNQVKETFTNIKITSNQQVKSTFSGTLNHTLTKLRQKLVGVSSTGSISGINPAGRLFQTEISNPRLSLATCFSQNEVLPTTGKEIWTIERGQSQVAAHSITYETSGSCTTTAIVKLSDGRTLQVII